MTVHTKNFITANALNSISHVEVNDTQVYCFLFFDSERYFENKPVLNGMRDMIVDFKGDVLTDEGDI